MNPIKMLRRRLRLTVDRFAEECGVTKDYIIKLEKGMYHEPSRAVVSYLSSEIPEFTETDIFQMYAEDQSRTPWQKMTDGQDNVPIPWEKFYNDFRSIDWNESGRHPYAWVRAMVCGFYGFP